MRLFRLILVVVVILTTVGQLWQERRRLGVLARLSGPEARDHYEETRARDERLMMAVTVVLVIAATAALVAVARRGRGA